jgi:hypothetical protein
LSYSDYDYEGFLLPLNPSYINPERPIIITKEYYDSLPEHEKANYKPIQGDPQ